MAEALPSVSAEYIERLLECSICLERFTSPRLLPCQHTFCCGCLLGLVDTRRYCLRCPSCRRVHRVPSNGVHGFPNNLTIGALLDIPTEQKQSTEASPADEVAVKETDQPEPCADCGSVAKAVSCFHCDRRLCHYCKECHKQSVQDEITEDLTQIHEKVTGFSAGLKTVKTSITELNRDLELSKSQTRDAVELLCQQVKDAGSQMLRTIDKKYQPRMQQLQGKSEKMEMYIVSMESFYTFTSSKMKQKTVQLSDEELKDAMAQCSSYLGRSSRVAALARRSSIDNSKSKGKRHARSSSGNRSNVQRPSMRRLQSLPDMDQDNRGDGEQSQRRLPTIPTSDTDDDRQQMRSPPPKFTIGELQVTPPILQAHSPEVMDTEDREPVVPRNVSMTVDLPTASGADTVEPTEVPEQDPAYTGIAVKAVIGKRGSRFWNPSAVCVSPFNGMIIVIDSYKNCVHILDADGHFVTSFGSGGSREGQFDYPSACVCTREGYIIITDAFNHRVQVLDKYGKFRGKFGTLGSAGGHLEGPTGVALDSNNYIYIADTNNRRIQVYDHSGGHVHTFGTPETLPSTFQDPRYSCLAIAPNGDVYVSDIKNHCVHVFSYAGVYLRSIGRQGSGLGEFICPRGVALDKNNNLLVADRDNHRVQLFHSGGDFLYGFGSQGERAGQFHGPEGVAVAENGDIVVAECGGQRVQIFTANPLAQL